MRLYDADSNGMLDREEFMVFMSSVRGTLFPMKAEREKLHDREIFLGGSCDPTTWRQDIVIPLLDSFQVTYYNPQVKGWHQGLIALENQAKAEALVQFFVIDDVTRALSSIVEVA